MHRHRCAYVCWGKLKQGHSALRREGGVVNLCCYTARQLRGHTARWGQWAPWLSSGRHGWVCAQVLAGEAPSYGTFAFAHRCAAAAILLQ